MKTRPAAGIRAGQRAPASPEAVISTFLRFGVLTAAFIILLGVALYVAESGVRAILLSPSVIPPESERDPSSLRLVLDQLLPRQPAAVTDVGLLVLIATPVVGVATAIVTFARERDWTYVWIATLVLAMLILGFAIGRA